MGKYTDDEIRAMPKITAKIAADYLGISPMMVTLGMRTMFFQSVSPSKRRTDTARAGVTTSFRSG